MKMNVVVIVVLVALSLGYFASERNVRESEAFIGGGPGRYTIVGMGARRSAYILDTQEGNLRVVGPRDAFYPQYTGQARTPHK